MAVLVTLLWSSSWVLIRWGLDDEGIAPITFAGLRYAVAAALLVGWLLLSPRAAPRSLAPDRRELARLMLLGVVLIAVAQGAQYVAIEHQPAATTSLVFALTPLFVAVSAAIALAERPTGRQIAGVLCVAAGAALYLGGELWATAAGMVAAVVGLAANVAGSLLGRDINRDARLSPTLVTTASIGVGAALLLGTGLIIEGSPSLSPRAWLLIAWLAAVNTAFAFTLWNRSLQRLTAVESASINNLMLVEVALLAWLALGEDPGPLGLVGIIVVSVGVLLTQRRGEDAQGSTQAGDVRSPVLADRAGER